jgi:2-hydroxy-6-oxonona-2,4-dienedioate hydrolase
MDIAEAHQNIARLDALAEHHSVLFSPGRAMRWRVFGKGEPVVLIHGGHGSWLHWVRNIEALAVDHRVLVPDLPGFGDSDDLAPGAGMQQLVEAVIASLDTLLEGREDIGLAAFSFGAAAAARIAVQRGAVRRLALLGAARTGTPHRPRAALIRWRKADPAEQDAALRHNLLAHMLHDAAAVDALALRVHTDACLRTRFHSKRISRAGGLAGALDRHRGPLLLAWGEHDVTAEPEAAIRGLVEGRPERQGCIVPGAGHWVQYERADEVNRLLLEWLGTEESGDST